jgi:hypothetical protein
MLARILSSRHGFTCTTLFATDPVDGTINPVCQTNIPGLDSLAKADLMLLFIRFRELPDAQMQHIDAYLKSGKPVIGLRTATHAFAYERNKQSPYARYDWRNKDWPGGFGQQILGETWVDHHGVHGKESTRGIINPAFQNHPVLRGVEDLWGPTDVYSVIHLPKDAQTLVLGQVLAGMQPNSPPLDGPKNKPMMPLAWLRELPNASGTPTRIMTSTMGSAVDFQNESLRRLVVNGCYWAVGLEKEIPPRSDVAFVGDYTPSYFGFGKHTPGVQPASLGRKP